MLELVQCKLCSGIPINDNFYLSFHGARLGLFCTYMVTYIYWGDIYILRDTVQLLRIQSGWWECTRSRVKNIKGQKVKILILNDVRHVISEQFSELPNVHPQTRTTTFKWGDSNEVFPIQSRQNKLAKLGDAIAISKSETINHWPTHWLTDWHG